MLLVAFSFDIGKSLFLICSLQSPGTDRSRAATAQTQHFLKLHLICLYADVKEHVGRVTTNGLKPVRFSNRRQNSKRFKRLVFSNSESGGPDRTRTYDPALIKRML